MTVKQMAEVAGVSPDTIRRAGKSIFPLKFEQGKRVTFNQSEAIEVMKCVRKKNMVQLPQNAEVLQQTAEVESTLTQRDMALIAGIVSQVFENLSNRLGKIETRFEQRRELLPPQPLSHRKRLAMIINSYCSRNGYDQRSAYQELYRDFNYRYNSNVNLRAKNRGIRIIDQIDNDGMLPELLSVAAEIFAPNML